MIWSRLCESSNPFADVAEVDRLEPLCFEAAWTLGDYFAHVEQVRQKQGEAKLILGGLHWPAASGFCFMSIVDGAAAIDRLGVAHFARRQGLARALLQTAINIADPRGFSLSLLVDVRNEAAIRLYEASGFHRATQLKAYCQPSGSDAYRMVYMKPGKRRS